jgi:hypothetical protein
MPHQRKGPAGQPEKQTGRNRGAPKNNNHIMEPSNYPAFSGGLRQSHKAMAEIASAAQKDKTSSHMLDSARRKVQKILPGVV